jgi:subtilisin family serine protease
MRSFWPRAAVLVALVAAAWGGWDAPPPRVLLQVDRYVPRLHLQRWLRAAVESANASIEFLSNGRPRGVLTDTAVFRQLASVPALALLQAVRQSPLLGVPSPALCNASCEAHWPPPGASVAVPRPWRAARRQVLESSERLALKLPFAPDSEATLRQFGVSETDHLRKGRPILAAGPACDALDRTVVHNIPPSLGSVASLTGAWAAWKAGLTGEGVTVAVLDTGIDDAAFEHTDEAPSRDAQCSVVNVRERSTWTNEGRLDDWSGHGTFVAGVIGSGGARVPQSECAAGSTDATHTECPGVSPRTEILAVRVFASGQLTYTSWLIDALNHAVARGADIVNLSIGGPDASDVVLTDKVTELASLGVVVVSAIGNDGPDWGTLNSPADMAGVVGVGGVEWDADMACPVMVPTDTPSGTVWTVGGASIAPFSSRGAVSWGVSEVGYGRVKPDLVAPSRALRSIRMASQSSPSRWGMWRHLSEHPSPQEEEAVSETSRRALWHPGVVDETSSGVECCKTMSGTSVASPVVSGAASLIVQALRLRDREMRASLASSARANDSSFWDVAAAGWRLPLAASEDEGAQAVLSGVGSPTDTLRPFQRPPSLVSPAAVQQVLWLSSLPLLEDEGVAGTAHRRAHRGDCAADFISAGADNARAMEHGETDPFTSVSSVSWFEQGAGLVNPVAATAWARAYRPHISLFPPSIRFVSDCPRWAPLCDWPLDPHSGAPPLFVNLSVANGISESSALSQTASIHLDHTTGSDKVWKTCEMSLGLHTQPLWVGWSGWLAFEWRAEVSKSQAALCQAAVEEHSRFLPPSRRRLPDGRHVAQVRGEVVIEVENCDPLLPAGSLATRSDVSRRLMARDAARLLDEASSGAREIGASRSRLEGALRVEPPTDTFPLTARVPVLFRGPRPLSSCGTSQQIVVPFEVAIAESPTPSNRVAAIDVRHSLKYPPFFALRDDLSNGPESLDWLGDHPHTNLKHLTLSLERAGWKVEVVNEAWTDVDASRIGVLFVVDPEDEWTPGERSKLVSDVHGGGMSLVVFAEWYDEGMVSRSGYFDESSRSWWSPTTGAANVPALNYLLSPFGVQFHGRALEGELLSLDAPEVDRVIGYEASFLDQSGFSIKRKTLQSPQRQTLSTSSQHEQARHRRHRGESSFPSLQVWRWARFASGTSISASPPSSRVWAARTWQSDDQSLGPQSESSAVVMAAFEAHTLFGDLLEHRPSRHITPGRVVVIGDSSCTDTSIRRKGVPSTAPSLSGVGMWRPMCSRLLEDVTAWVSRQSDELPSISASAVPLRGASGPLGEEGLMQLWEKVPGSTRVPPSMSDAARHSTLGFTPPLPHGFLSDTVAGGSGASAFSDSDAWLSVLREGPRRPADALLGLASFAVRDSSLCALRGACSSDPDDAILREITARDVWEAFVDRSRPSEAEDGRVLVWGEGG